MTFKDEDFAIPLPSNPKISKPFKNRRDNIDGVKAGQTSRVTVAFLWETKHVFIVKGKRKLKKGWDNCCKY